MPLFPVWTNITKIDNAFLRTAMLTAKGATQKKLAEDYPDCFTTEQRDMVIPASRFYEQTAEIYRRGEGSPPNDRERKLEIWPEYLEELGIPVAFEWSNSELVENHDPIPDEVWPQIMGKASPRDRINPTDFVIEYKGERFLIVWLFDDVTGSYHDPITEEQRDTLEVRVILASMIDLTA